MKTSLTITAPGSGFTFKIDPVWLAILLIAAAVIAADTSQSLASAEFVARTLLLMAPLIVLAAAAGAYSKATGLDNQISRVFSQSPAKGVILASVFGALSPFCSCGVIALVAGMLRAGVPLGPVMAFWIASPIMDPQMFVLTSAVLGIPFALAKTLAAISMGLLSGLLVNAATARGRLLQPLKPDRQSGAGLPPLTRPVWRFWNDPQRAYGFRSETFNTMLFLFKWLTLAFLLESLMLAYIPTEWIHQLGAGEWWSIPAVILFGAPLYLNGYAAIPLASGLLEQGMLPGAALAFLVGGGVTSIPAAMSVYALVRRPIFFTYLALGTGGALLAGILFQLAQ